MTLYTSKKWSLFINRPTPLLKREFLKQTYFHVDVVSDLRITRLLIIFSAGDNQVFVPVSQDADCERLATRDYKNGRAEKILSGFEGVLNRFHSDKKDVVGKALDAFKKVGGILIYTFYLERVLDKASVYGLNADERKRLCRLIVVNSRLRDHGAQIIYGSFDKARSRLKKMCPDLDIDYYLLDELIGRRTVSSAEIARRKKFFVMMANKDMSRIYTGKIARDILRREGFARHKVANASAVRGLSAYSGKTIGEVVCVKGIDDFKIKNVVEKIFVSVDTIIDYVPYLKKVKAIVTDGGGLTSHPAIVAREFKIPCVVGTKIATRIFKDGDMVEVDANLGVVRKL